ncbi:peptidase M28 family protein [Sphingomonas changbaiensis NBRC 104936]|uniref:Peptidase M28 family protein n=1 Tax=Sphingomonas changbaiensis NBRC 104936 TaxID=1219043 RepID=A0A0E9MQP3_9SPHN|nr:M28 family metallopeptidase [Sphingomonas changbaiensis]GAO39771.1 peptidase M28 family protein [Sphingomonas changbaiensis NBRC 104936]
MPRVLLSLLPLALVSAAPPAPAPVFTPEAFRAHVAFLADDLLEGRDTGSRGHEIAARYVASQFAGLGLKPGGDGGSWYQQVTFQKTRRGDTPGTLTLSGAKGSQRWTHGQDVIIGINPREAKTDLSAPIVFVGYGLADKSLGIDDYQGLDVRGKIVVALNGFPKGMPSEVGAHLSEDKGNAAVEHGAVGLIGIDTNLTAATRPWAVRQRYSDGSRFNWIGADGQPHEDAPGLRASAGVDDTVAAALFAGAPHTLDQIRAEAERDGGRPKGFPLAGTVRVVAQTASERLTSPNVIGVLPGSDPALAPQVVILSAHLDHIGISKPRPNDPPNKDRINNGALDNASGIATMLEVARAAATAPTRPRRTLVFLASTAEEKGLLGAEYYAHNPTVPLASIVADVDLDMPLLLYPFTDVVAFGADHSTLGKVVADAAKPMNIALSPDPMPAENIFVRSDHYRFVQQGVPAVFLATGYANGGEAAWKAFFDKAYHQPADDMNQAIDWNAAARFAEVNYRITRALADADEAPRWYTGDYFGDLFAPKAPKAPR